MRLRIIATKSVAYSQEFPCIIVHQFLFNYKYSSKNNPQRNVKFEVLMVVSINIKVLWDMTTGSLANRCQCFGKTCRLHLRGGASILKINLETLPEH
jgi:hypothetical protein